MMFVEYNNNPNQRITSDCVIRCISKALNKDYEEVYTDLFNVSLDTGYFISDYKCYETYLLNNGFTKCTYKYYNEHETVEQLSNRLCNNTIIIRCNTFHLTCSVKGSIFDIKNPSGMTVNWYYVHE